MRYRMTTTHMSTHILGNILSRSVHPTSDPPILGISHPDPEIVHSVAALAKADMQSIFYTALTTAVKAAQEKNNGVNILREVLTWVLGVQTPLTEAQLVEAVRFGVGGLDLADWGLEGIEVFTCGIVVARKASGWSTVGFSNSYLKGYLTNLIPDDGDEILKGSKVDLRMDRVNIHLAKRCLVYLAQKAMGVIQGDGGSFGEYANTFWHCHARGHDSDPQIAELIISHLLLLSPSPSASSSPISSSNPGMENDPLVVAAGYGLSRTVVTLLKHRDPKPTEEILSATLLSAAKSNHQCVVSVLLPFLPLQKHKSIALPALETACLRGHIPILRNLLTPDTQSLKELTDHLYGEFVLKGGHIDVLIYFHITLGYHITIPDIKPHMYPVIYDHRRVYRYLLSVHRFDSSTIPPLDIHAESLPYGSAIVRACLLGRIELIRELLGYGADASHVTDYDTPVSAAVRGLLMKVDGRGGIDGDDSGGDEDEDEDADGDETRKWRQEVEFVKGIVRLLGKYGGRVTGSGGVERGEEVQMRCGRGRGLVRWLREVEREEDGRGGV